MATHLLIAIGLRGARDMAAFATRVHRPRQQPTTRAELVTLAVRGPTYAISLVVA